MRIKSWSSASNPLPLSFEQMIASVQKKLPSDDLETIYMYDMKLACLYLEPVINQQRFHDEIVPVLPQWSDKPEQWDAVFPQGVLVSQTNDLLDRILHGEIINKVKRG